jgi:hypothetical protein
MSYPKELESSRWRYGNSTGRIDDGSELFNQYFKKKKSLLGISSVFKPTAQLF